MNDCDLCQQEPYASRNEPCPWHRPEPVAERNAWWVEYESRKAANPDYMDEDTNPGPRYEGCA